MNYPDSIIGPGASFVKMAEPGVARSILNRITKGYNPLESDDAPKKTGILSAAKNRITKGYNPLEGDDPPKKTGILSAAKNRATKGLNPSPEKPSLRAPSSSVYRAGKLTAPQANVRLKPPSTPSAKKKRKASRHKKVEQKYISPPTKVVDTPSRYGKYGLAAGGVLAAAGGAYGAKKLYDRHQARKAEDGAQKTAAQILYENF